MSFKSFAVAGGLGGDTPGSAALGPEIVKALLANGAHVKILTRQGSGTKASALESAGAAIATVDYDKSETIVAALQGVDVLISAFGSLALAAQEPLVDAAAKANVSLFVPSEFGNPTNDITDSKSPLYTKTALQDKAKQANLPTALFFNGPFSDWIARYVTPKDGKVTITGDGTSPISWTSIKDVAGFVAFVLTHQQPIDLKDKVFRIEGSRKSWNDILPFVKEKHAQPFEVVHEPVADAEKRWAESYDFVSFLLAEWAQGGGLVGEPLSNKLWPKFPATPVESFL